MSAKLAARVFIALCVVVAAFQLALILGAPWGHLTWGGRYAGVLPPGMRVVAGVSLMLMLVFAHTIAVRAGIRGSGATPPRRWPTWAVVAYCSVGVLANAATPSFWERVVWLPVVSLMLVTSVFVARNASRGEAAPRA